MGIATIEISKNVILKSLSDKYRQLSIEDRNILMETVNRLWRNNETI